MENRVKLFQDLRFGMFIHFGLYSIIGKGEWVRSIEKISNKDYEKYFEEFNPIKYNPKKWLQAAKDAGMKYVVLTSKHHDGFCLFDSKYTEYKSTNTPIKKDLIKEYVEAAREVGLKVGIYYSLIDWHHKDYPKYKDRFHPERDNEKFKDEVINFDNYLEYMHNQVKELVTNYGKIDILWFDFSYDDMIAKKWKAEELIKMVKSYQKDVVINNRIEGSGEQYGSIISENPSIYSGDFISPEQLIPHTGILNVKNEPVAWELCNTLNNNWGYSPYDNDYKSAKFVIRHLVECVSKGGNMILNVAPNALGELKQINYDVLKEIGEWMDLYGESIYECKNSNIEKPEWGYYTYKKGCIYAHIFDAPLGVLALKGIDSSKIKSVRRVSDGTEVKISNSWTTLSYEGVTFVELGKEHYTFALENDIDTVIKINLKEDLW